MSALKIYRASEAMAHFTRGHQLFYFSGLDKATLVQDKWNWWGFQTDYDILRRRRGLKFRRSSPLSAIEAFFAYPSHDSRPRCLLIESPVPPPPPPVQYIPTGPKPTIEIRVPYGAHLKITYYEP